MLSCLSCGGALKPDAQFCPHCGAAIIRPTTPLARGQDATVGERVVATFARSTPRLPPPALLVAGVVLLFALAAIGGIAAYQVMAARPGSPVPAGAVCGEESAVRSANGPVDELLTVTNRTAAPIEVHWIDFDGRREKHFDVAPEGTRRQRTPRSYPWVITTQGGDCLRLVTVPGTVVIED